MRRCFILNCWRVGIACSLGSGPAYMPDGGTTTRGRQDGYFATIAHTKLLTPPLGRLLYATEKAELTLKL